MKKSGIRLISDERKRQISEEGWTPEHDDEHCEAALAFAGVSYALSAARRVEFCEFAGFDSRNIDYTEPPDLWPWDRKWWKPGDPVRMLVKAGALIAAEIDRLQRAGAE